MQGSADQDAGFKRFRVQDAGFRSPNHITRASGVGLRFQGFQHLGFGVSGSGFRVQETEADTGVPRS